MEVLFLTGVPVSLQRMSGMRSITVHPTDVQMVCKGCYSPVKVLLLVPGTQLLIRHRQFGMIPLDLPGMRLVKQAYSHMIQ